MVIWYGSWAKDVAPNGKVFARVDMFRVENGKIAEYGQFLKLCLKNPKIRIPCSDLFRPYLHSTLSALKVRIQKDSRANRIL